MRKSLLGIMFILAFILFGFQECVPPGTSFPEPTPASGVERASMNGKYTELLEVLDVPGDQATYGDLYEMGYKTTKSYKGYTNLPAGYWVYVSPSWYIWKNQKGADDSADTDETRPDPDYDAGSLDGTYEKILKTLYVPEDRGKYGTEYDWGYRTVTSYRDHTGIPKGYWAYAYPYWYIWEKEAAPETPALDYTLGSYNGAYKNILKTLYVPGDKTRYGELYDWGYRTAASYQEYSGLPKGYWVYASPYWYIWGDEAQTYTEENKKTAAVNGKYSDLLTVLTVESDRSSYGSFYDAGYKKTTTYKGNTNIPAGYWVYVYPNWFIWSEKAVTWTQEEQRRASVNGTYSNLLDVIRVDEDEGTYGKFKDFDYSDRKTYKEYTDLTPGYWVYVSPNWFIWGSKKGTGDTEPPEGDTSDPTTAYGKYYGLIRQIFSPLDVINYGEYKDLGYKNFKEYAGETNIPPGYWVWSAPYWYVYENTR